MSDFPVSPPPLRVLHLTGVLDRGGIESWLLNLARQQGRPEVAMDVLVVSPGSRPGTYDDDFRALGVGVTLLPPVTNPLTFALQFWQTLRRQGPYDVVHSHIHHFGGLALALARLAGVPVRVATSHTDTSRDDGRAVGVRYAYLTLMRIAMQLGVTHRLAVTPGAARALFGPQGARDTLISDLGLDLAALRAPSDPAALRRDLELPPGQPVFGHVARLRPEKNQLFLLDIFAAYLEAFGPAQLLLIGDGPLRPEIEARVRALGLGEQVRLLGSQSGVPALLGVMDVFLLPSLFEGRSLALLEAQVVGLPCVVSDRVQPGLPPLRNPQAVQSLPLDAPAGRWAEALATAHGRGRAEYDLAGIDIRVRAAELTELYRRALRGEA